jgi:cyclohexanecarboxylate-CoA ligase
LWELIRERARSTPNSVCVVDELGQVTFAELVAASERMAAGLSSLGVGEETVVSWLLPNWREALFLTAALSRLGAVQAPLLPIYRHREVAFITRQVGAAVLVLPAAWRSVDYQAIGERVADQYPLTLVVVEDRRFPSASPSGLPEVSAHPGDVRWVFYTSGTTAEPKGAQHSDRSLLAAARCIEQRLEVTGADRNAMVFPFAHIGGALWLFISALTGCANILSERFDPIATVNLLNRAGVTLAGAGTAFHLSYLQAQEAAGERLFKEVRAFPSGAARKPPTLHRLMMDTFGVGLQSAYGMTEAPVLTMTGIGDSDEVLSRTEGRPCPGVDLKIVPTGEAGEGEILIKAPQLMRGYVDPDLNRDAYDDDGYFRTGDIGRLDDEGNLIITGREKDIIIRKGENISAKEIEDLIFAVSEVREVAVVGVPDEEVGERCCVVIVATDPANPPTLERLCAHLSAEGVMVQKFPERLLVLPELPRNDAGKVVKRELQSMIVASGVR